MKKGLSVVPQDIRKPEKRALGPQCNPWTTHAVREGKPVSSQSSCCFRAMISGSRISKGRCQVVNGHTQWALTVDGEAATMIVGIVGLEGGDRQPFSAVPWLPVFRGTDAAYRPGPRLKHTSGLFGCSNMDVSCDIQGVSSAGDGKDSGRENYSALHWVEKHRSSARFQR